MYRNSTQTKEVCLDQSVLIEIEAEGEAIEVELEDLSIEISAPVRRRRLNGFLSRTWKKVWGTVKKLVGGSKEERKEAVEDIHDAYVKVKTVVEAIKIAAVLLG